VEIKNQPNSLAGHFQVGQWLGFRDWQDVFDAFEFQN